MCTSAEKIQESRLIVVSSRLQLLRWSESIVLGSLANQAPLDRSITASFFLPPPSLSASPASPACSQSLLEALSRCQLCISGPFVNLQYQIASSSSRFQSSSRAIINSRAVEQLSSLATTGQLSQVQSSQPCHICADHLQTHPPAQK